MALRPYQTYLGASVFGIAATRPDQVAQNIPAMARDLDYVAPMVYPSQWNDGEYDVADPNDAAVPDRAAVAARLQARRRGHRRETRAVAAGLLARGDLRAEAGEGADCRRPAGWGE